MITIKLRPVAICLGLIALCVGAQEAAFPPFEVVVEVEENAFPMPAYLDTNNGSAMFWGSGNTHLGRIGERLFATAHEVVPGCAPLNNARWALYERKADGWHLCQRDETERTREDTPLAVSHDGRLLLSVNPTLAPWEDAPPDLSTRTMAKRGGEISHQWRGGPARPEFLEIDLVRPEQPPKVWQPPWRNEPKFTEHTYRSFSADGANGEFLLMTNIGNTHAEWALLDRNREWHIGQIHWPPYTIDPAYTPYHAKTARVNYRNVILHNRAVHVFGETAYNIWNRIDPEKPETWGRANWGGRIRKLFYAWTPDLTATPFSEWVALDDTMDDGGTVSQGDAWLAPDGRVHVVWTTAPIHPGLRNQYFPDIKRDQHLRYGVVQDGKVLEKRTLCSGGETTGPLWPEGKPRFHATPDHQLYILFYLRDVSTRTPKQTGLYAVRVETDGSVSPPVRIPVEHPSSVFYTTTPRSGNPASETAELLGSAEIDGKLMNRYIRLRFQPAAAPLVEISGQKLRLPGEGRTIRLESRVRDLQNDAEPAVAWQLPGDLVQHGKSLEWTAPPEAGETFTIRAVARDAQGHEGSATVVVSLPPPALANLETAIRIEAEDYVAEGGGTAKICDPYQASGRSISYWHQEIGHWLEWEADIAVAGRYELWLRYTTACTATRRSLLLNGTSPGPAFADIPFPGTGGWSGTEDQWRYRKLPAPLDLPVGKHRLRLTNLADGLGADFLLLVPLP
ncbi:MAG: hypothetical protein RBU25_04985 [Lentisphaeria bacterium]|jgi:hypothetical protein|nr:hypothetical protein [Lentisphaeria bacterium]